VEIPVRKWISKSSPLVPATYQGCLQKYCGQFGEGPGVWGEDPILDPLLAGKSAIYNQASTTEPFGVAIVLLGSNKYLNKVQPLKYF
jgi:hypothetical protein